MMRKRTDEFLHREGVTAEQAVEECPPETSAEPPTKHLIVKLVVSMRTFTTYCCLSGTEMGNREDQGFIPLAELAMLLSYLVAQLQRRA